MSVPEDERIKRKTALRKAREKLAQRKKEREVLRIQKAKRLGGNYSLPSSSSSSQTPASINALNNQSKSNINQDDDIFDDMKSNQQNSILSAPVNKASLYRKPRELNNKQNRNK